MQNYTIKTGGSLLRRLGRFTPLTTVNPASAETLLVPLESIEWCSLGSPDGPRHTFGTQVPGAVSYRMYYSFDDVTFTPWTSVVPAATGTSAKYGLAPFNTLEQTLYYKWVWIDAGGAESSVDAVSSTAFTTPNVGQIFYSTSELRDAIPSLATFSFDVTGALNAPGDIGGASSVTFTSSAALTSVGVLSGSAGVAFSSSAGLTQTGTNLQAAITFLNWSSFAFPRGTGELVGAASLEFTTDASIGTERAVGFPLMGGFRWLGPYRVARLSINEVAAAATALSGSASIGFTTAASLSVAAPDAVVGATSITFSASGNLLAGGALGGFVDIQFSGAGVATNGAASALVGNTTVTFGSSATAIADGALSGASSVTFGSNARLTSGAISGSSSLTFSSSAQGSRRRVGGGSTTVTFDSNAELLGLGGESISGSATITFTGAATPRPEARIELVFSSNATLTPQQTVLRAVSRAPDEPKAPSIRSATRRGRGRVSTRRRRA